MDVDRDLAAEALVAHQVFPVDGPDDTRQWVCRCTWAGTAFPSGLVATNGLAARAAVRHQAERVVDAIRLGAPEVSGSEPEPASDAPEQTVAAAAEVS